MFTFIRRISIVSLLTVLTQVGGVVYLFYQLIKVFIKKKRTNKLSSIARTAIFIGLYLITTFFFIPPIAKQFGRVPLPYFATQTSNIKPLKSFTYLLNRHYVKPKLLATTTNIANALKREYPESQVVYLDANFPFWNGFPLLPHLSHNDGKKLDLAFIYKDAKTQKTTNSSPSFIGYGVFEGPRKRELNQPNNCRKKGYWQYGFLGYLTPQWNKEKMVIDEVSNKKLLQLLAEHKAIGKVFIEPHLKTRWGLKSYNKIRYHGCHAVRHDDHIHIQL